MCKRFGCHHSITRMLYSVFVAVFVTATLVVGIYSTTTHAQATPGMLPFGGHILYNVPLPIPNALNTVAVPVPPCPPHIVIIDYSFGFPKVIGITLAGLSFGPIFEFYNTATPGIATLGEYAPLPLPVCSPLNPGVYYPVFDAFYNPTMGLFQMGTGAVPGF